MNPIQLIIGLGNPGPDYAKTRHNAGAWFVEKVAANAEIQLRLDKKIFGLYGQIELDNHKCHLFIPTTFMNLSGQAVRAVASFYKIFPKNILIAHDELDLPPGMSRLKFDGGHGGHNGLRDIIQHLNTNQFHRLRIGIGHPGNAKDVIEYVLKVPTKSQQIAIDNSIDIALQILPDLGHGRLQHAMKTLHTNK